MRSVLTEVFEGFETVPEFVSVLAAPDPMVLLALDVGTSGVRAALFAEQCREIEGARAHSNRDFASLGEVEELDANELFELVGRTLDQLFENAGSAIDRVHLIAASCFWHSLMGVDTDWRPTTPIFGWANTSAGHAAQQLRTSFNEREIHVRTGLPASPQLLARETAMAESNAGPGVPGDCALAFVC
jgi:sugar (pentulose or hexulose) kinase